MHRFGEMAFPLEWIDEYVARLRGYVFVRGEDQLLIKVPNEAYKLNASGVRILERLLAGDGAVALWRSFGGTEDVRRELYQFMVGLKQILQGCVSEHRLPASIAVKPFALGFNTLPILSEVALTYRCNLSCRFCYAGCSCHKASGAAIEMTSDEVRRILDVIRNDARVPSVSFTGGEPTLRPDLPELVGYARRTLGLRVNVITNGVLVDAALAKKLGEAGLNSAQVSIESPDAATHDALTGAVGSHERSVAALERFAGCGIAVHTNTTITARNAESATAMPAFVRGLGLERLSMNLMIPADAGAQAADLAVRYEEVAELVLRVRAAAARAGVEFLWYSPTPVCMFNPIPHGLGNKGCAACDGLLSISPEGGVLPCSSWPEPVGNLLREPFRAVWESARARRLRAKTFAPPLCQGCEDFALCQGACPLYWRHFGFEELERHGEAYVATQRRTAS